MVADIRLGIRRFGRRRRKAAIFSQELSFHRVVTAHSHDYSLESVKISQQYPLMYHYCYLRIKYFADTLDNQLAEKNCATLSSVKRGHQGRNQMTPRLSKQLLCFQDIARTS